METLLSAHCCKPKCALKVYSVNQRKGGGVVCLLRKQGGAVDPNQWHYFLLTGSKEYIDVKSLEKNLRRDWLGEY